MIWLLVALAAWAGGWWINARLAASPLSRRRAGRIAVPVIFGVTVLILWEGLVRGLGVSPVILPPPSAVAARFGDSSFVMAYEGDSADHVLVAFAEKLRNKIMAQQFEIGMRQQLFDIGLVAGEEVIGAENLMPRFQ